MTHRRRGSRPPAIPQRRVPDPAKAPTLYELERFSLADLRHWKRLSPLLDQLQRELYYGLESQRAAHREELLAALRQQRAASLDIAGWVRIVDYQYCLEPLSPRGSVRRYGGRFNIGPEVGEGSFRTFPALYLAENLETAFRERFQLEQAANVDGLSAEELSLQTPGGFLVAGLKGRVESVFDIRDPKALNPFVDIIARFRLPDRVRALCKALNMPTTYLIRSPTQLQRALMARDWRAWPIQFDVPSNSQVFGQLVRDAGFEAVLYGSSKNSQRCIALFPENMRASQSRVELAGPYPHEVAAPVLNSETVEQLLAGC
jgi:hypothetical protein